MIRIIDALPPGSHIITGGCIGVDAAVARYAYTHGFRVHTVVPADRSRVDEQWSNWCHTYTIMPPNTTYRQRNYEMVRLADDAPDGIRELRGIAAYPEHDGHSTRSGTWQTIRFARSRGFVTDVHIMSDLTQEHE